MRVFGRKGNKKLTFEVFHQKKRGQHHVHVGIVHAPNQDMALLYAKEQYARRGVTSNIWVVSSHHVHATEYFDDDIFDTTPEKLHRDPASYKVMDRIKEIASKLVEIPEWAEFGAGDTISVTYKIK